MQEKGAGAWLEYFRGVRRNMKHPYNRREPHNERRVVAYQLERGRTTSKTDLLTRPKIKPVLFPSTTSVLQLRFSF